MEKKKQGPGKAIVNDPNVKQEEAKQEIINKQEEIDEDLDVQILDPAKDCVDVLGLEKVKDYESWYWEKV